MSLLNIIQFPDPSLKLAAESVIKITDEIRNIISSMLETMYQANGVGLAATQVNIQKRIIVIDVSESANQPLALINPKILTTENTIIWEEGCLSFPGVYAKVKRAKKITVKYLDLEGKEQTLSTEDLLAICIQHEIDHLNGITFYDHLSRLKQKLIRDKLAKIRSKRL